MFDRLKAGLKQPRDKSCNEWWQKWSRRWAASSCFLKPPRMAAAMARVRPARTVTDKLFAYLSYQDAPKSVGLAQRNRFLGHPNPTRRQRCCRPR